MHEVLENIGATTELRDLQVKVSTSIEILHTIYFRLITETKNTTNSSSKSRRRSREAETHYGSGYFCRSGYICGSGFEGTTTKGLESDVDLVIVMEYLPVVTDVSDAQFRETSFLMIEDFYTPPGYVKLQLLDDGIPQFRSSENPQADSISYDKEDRIVFICSSDIMNDQDIHGPARSTPATETYYAFDYVPAVRCRKIPDCASEWFTRQRRYNWPTTELIDKCKALGCFYVFVGHPDSEEKHLQFRISFSLQERLLVTQFNSVQLKCYIVMKIIKKDIIHKDLGEKSLTSYHCKTCLLYLIENTPAEFWREDNLLVCLYTYMSQILRCVEKMDCPNYFIPDENMFAGRLNREIHIKLRMVLKNLLSADFQFLLKLKTDDLGERFQDAIVHGVHQSRFISNVEYMKKVLVVKHVNTFIINRNIMLKVSLNSDCDIAETSQRLNWLKLRLQNTRTVTEHTQEQTETALSAVCQYIEISHISVMAAVLEKPLHKSNAFQILTGEKWELLSQKSDQFSSKLKQASLLYVLEFPEVSLDILENLERRLRKQISFCGCSSDRRSVHKFKTEDWSSLESDIAAELLDECFIPCVIYLPAEKDLTPPAICDEMNRSLGFHDDNMETWYGSDWAMVDGKILLYFLMYLNHRHLGMKANAAADAENILSLYCTDKCLGHRETTLNLLGWIYKEEGRIDRAEKCFRMSLKIQPTQNAAFSHMRDLESETGLHRGKSCCLVT